MRSKAGEHIKKELKKLKELKVMANDQLTIANLKSMKAFERLSDDMAGEVIEGLKAYAKLVLVHINNGGLKKTDNER